MSVGAVALLFALKGPYVSAISHQAAEVRWEAPVLAGSPALVLGSGGAWSVTVKADLEDGMAVARIEGLRPDTAYRYRAEVPGGWSPTQSLRTFPTTGSPVEFVVFGDTRNDHATHARIADRIAAESPDFVVNTGDLVADGTEPTHWDAFFEAERRLLAVAPLFPAVGNHDARGLLNRSLLPRYFPGGRYRSVRAGSAALLILDSTQSISTGSEQGRWLLRALQEARAAVDRGEARWIFAVHHHPVWSSGHHGGDRALRRELVPLYERFGVTAVFSGHDHLYERLESGGITYFVTGGGGAPLYESTGLPETRARAKSHHYLRVTADETALTVVAVDPAGNVLDRTTFSPASPPAPARRDRLPALAPFGGLALAAAAAWRWSGRLSRGRGPRAVLEERAARTSTETTGGE